MSEKVIRAFVPAFFALYFVIGFGRWIGGATELYPVGAWGMFHRLPKTYDVYDLRIHRMAGRDIDPPILASSAPPELGLELDAHRLLVLNAFVQHSLLERPERAAPYRDFASLAMVGPDSKYEILHKEARARRNQRHKEETIAYGPFETSSAQPPRIEGARFDFPAQEKYRPKERDGHRRYKRKKSAK